MSGFDTENMGSFFLFVFSGVKISFRKTTIKSYPFGWCEENA